MQYATIKMNPINKVRQHITVGGVVQGVGFRPFVYGLAHRFGLTGFVGNDSDGVFIEVEGEATTLEAFRTELEGNPPPLAHIETITVELLPPKNDLAFSIVESKRVESKNAGEVADQDNQAEAKYTLISPDLSICDDCLSELFDPQDRRYLYPFINCTNCGPRFTIIQNIPYDRAFTTMAAFPMCADCQAEYNDPTNRRFHAQPNACPACGPQVWFCWKNDFVAELPPNAKGDAIEAAKNALTKGAIVAVKGLGGFHLACDATNRGVVQKLRERKGRQDKPFAVMVKDLNMARQLAYISSEEARLLCSRERPIVLLKKRESGWLAPEVAPGTELIGLMLPYTPLHYLLVGATPLVMTSGNFSNEPIVKDNLEAETCLGPLADAFLLHNRAIFTQADDSVVRIFEDHELPIRRSRGYAPFPVKLPFHFPSVLAVGGELKSTFCLTKENYAFMSQHIGDMENLETLETFSHTFDHLKSLFRVEPQLVACDKHPRYLSKTWAQKFAESNHIPLVEVQHHHAHIASAMVENNLDGTNPVIGFSFDGTGYGNDGAIWGGEVLIADYKSFRRIAHLKYVSLPGGDAAIKRPYRIALAHLWGAGLAWQTNLPPVTACSAGEAKILQKQLIKNFNTTPSSSMGRLFDGVASLIGVRQTINYEAQAAIEFEAIAQPYIKEAYKFNYVEKMDDIGIGWQIEPADLLSEIVCDLKANLPKGIIAAKFHNAVANLILELSLRIREQTTLNEVVLSGGVFQNVLLLGLAVERLRTHGFRVLTQQKVPPNDGGLALGQAAIASKQYFPKEL